jgi:hypothetical protein
MRQTTPSAPCTRPRRTRVPQAPRRCARRAPARTDGELAPDEDRLPSVSVSPKSGLCSTTTCRRLEVRIVLMSPKPEQAPSRVVFNRDAIHSSSVLVWNVFDLAAGRPRRRRSRRRDPRDGHRADPRPFAHQFFQNLALSRTTCICGQPSRSTGTRRVARATPVAPPSKLRSIFRLSNGARRATSRWSTASAHDTSGSNPHRPRRARAAATQAA